MPLSPAKIQSAVKYNPGASRKIGWFDEFGRVDALLGPGTSLLRDTEFAIKLGAWQAGQTGLTEDGKLGPGTWKRMKKIYPKSGPGVVPEWLKPKGLSPVEALAVGGHGPAWMRVAQDEQRRWDTAIDAMSKTEKDCPELHMSRDEEYFYSSPYFGGETQMRGRIPKNKKRRHWCAAFVNHCLHRAGYSHTGSAGAHSFTRRSLWHFDGCEEPERGCVIVVSDGTRGGHVAFLDRVDGAPDPFKLDKERRVDISKHRVKLLGGNQRGQRINSRVLDYRYMLTAVGRNGVRSPYMKPRRGPAVCNLDPTTAHPHHCGRTHKD